MRNKTAIYYNNGINYPEKPPFHPPKIYPEFDKLSHLLEFDENNRTYDAIRETFYLLKLDEKNYNTSKWNPLGEIINKGEKVVIKPNLVLHETGDLKGKHVLFTDASVIRVVIDYVAKAVGKNGKILIVDAPIQSADFELLKKQSGIESIENFCRDTLKYPLEVLDLRKEWVKLNEDGSQKMKHIPLRGDPKGYTTIDLCDNSLLNKLINDNVRFSVNDYDEKVTNQHHKLNKHEYMISNTVLDADVVINLPKLKTHKKSGITCALKNLIGIVGSKDYLAHHRIGSPQQGGDEFPDQTKFDLIYRESIKFLIEKSPPWFWKLIKNVGLSILNLKKSKDLNLYLIGGGGWYGNDTLWRTIHDINYAFFFYNIEKNKLMKEKQKKYFVLVDGIICGEGDGPLAPIPKHCGLLVAGMDPVIIDILCSRLIGFDWKKIPLLKAVKQFQYLTDFDGDINKSIICNDSKFKENINKESFKGFQFKPPKGWQNHIEI